jgi:hypothetical protein
MPRDPTQSEDALQITPADLDQRIFDSFRAAAPERENLPPPPAVVDDADIIDSSEVFSAPPPPLVRSRNVPIPAAHDPLVLAMSQAPVFAAAPAMRDEAPSPDEEPPAPLIDAPPPRPNGGAWTIPLVCFGIGVIAMALIVPAADENRRLVWERTKLARDLAHVERQIAINDEFLARLASDPGLAERLAQRQMKMVREGTSVLDLGRTGDPARSGAHEISPFELVTLPPPPPMPEYRPLGGKISALFHHPKSRLYLLGAGLLSLIVGVILGSTKDQPAGEPAA